MRGYCVLLCNFYFLYLSQKKIKAALPGTILTCFSCWQLLNLISDPENRTLYVSHHIVDHVISGFGVQATEMCTMPYNNALKLT